MNSDSESHLEIAPQARGSLAPSASTHTHEDGIAPGQDSTMPLFNNSENIKKQLALIQDAKIGSPDWVGQKIITILSKSDNFIIYRTEGDGPDDALRVFVAHYDPNEESKMIENYDKIHLELLEVYSSMHKSRNPDRIWRKLGVAIAMVIEANSSNETAFTDAKAICEKLARQINDEYSSLIKGKVEYLVGCLSVAMLLVILSITLYYNRNTEFVKHISAAREIMYSAAFASLGGVISASTSLNTLRFETDLPPFQYIFYGSTRIVVSILGGVIVHLLVKSGLIFNFINTLNNNHTGLYGLLAICFVAGFSEKLVPDLMKKFENHGSGKEE